MSTKIFFGDVRVDCIEARTPIEQSIGLCALDKLCDGEGMAFIYDEEQSRTFWMPAEMKFAIDIIFVGNDPRYVQRIYHHCTPGSKFRYTGRGMAVVEVPAGWCKRNGIEVGCPVGFGGSPSHGPMKMADACSDRLRGITTAELYAMKEPQKSVSMADVVAQSTETDPYQREPSVAPNPNPERFRDRQIPADYAPDAGSRFTQGPIRDESWCSPTRPASRQNLIDF